MIGWLKRLIGGDQNAPRMNADAEAFWREAEKQALESGVARNARQHYARLAPIAVEIGYAGNASAEQLKAGEKDTQALYTHLHSEHPDADNDELRKLLAKDMRACVRYWEDGTPTDTAIKGLNHLADAWFPRTPD